MNSLLLTRICNRQHLKLICTLLKCVNLLFQMYLLNQSIEQLSHLQVLDVNVLRPYGPVVETPQTQSSFLTSEPLDIILAGKSAAVPILIGYNNREGMMSEFITRSLGQQPIHDDFEKSIPLDMNLETGSAAARAAAQKIREFYYGEEEPSLETIENYVSVHQYLICRRYI